MREEAKRQEKSPQPIFFSSLSRHFPSKPSRAVGSNFVKVLKLKQKMVSIPPLLAVLFPLLVEVSLAESCTPARDAPLICTYFVPFAHNKEFAEDYIDLVKLWEESWALQGWRTTVLTDEDAMTHPLYAANVEAIQNLPTLNNKNYELSCYLRWFAAVQAGCGTRQ
jgi:hypothetical protein